MPLSIRRSQGRRKAGARNQPIRSFRGLLDHLGTLTRNNLRYGDVTIPPSTNP